MPHIATQFRALHQPAAGFIIPNPWDVGSARILAALGFSALATTSAGLAFSLGVREGSVTRTQTLRHCQEMVAATDLPVSADLEKGFGDSPESVAQTIRAAAATGLAGCSIEDYTGTATAPIYDFPLAVERVTAAVEACRALPDDFVFTARAENHLYGRDDLDDTITRLLAFEAAGADVLYAPGLRNLADIQQICTAVSRPVNVVIGLPGTTFTATELRTAGATRISTGSALACAALGEFVRSAREIAAQQTFGFADNAIGFGEVERLLGGDGGQE